jgi:hypothetical protein
MQSPSDTASRFFLGAIGAGAFTTVLRVMISEKDGYRRPVLWALLALSVVVLAGAAWWEAFKASFGTALADSIGRVASSAASWLALIGLLCLYVAASSLVERYRDKKMGLIFAAIQKYVMPRELTPKKLSFFLRYLEGFPPHDVRLHVLKNNGEAARFMQQVSSALTRAGWRVKLIAYVADADEGLVADYRFNFNPQTIHDPKNPKPDELLVKAFGVAGFAVGGRSGSLDPGETESVLTLIIGHQERLA